jgi:ribosomal protein L4
MRSRSRRATRRRVALASGRVTARDVMDTDRVIATKAAIEKLQESLG